MDLISVEEAAKSLDVHVQTIRRFIRSGTVRAFKKPGMGNKFYVAAEDVERLKRPIPVEIGRSAPGAQLVLPEVKAKPAHGKKR